MCKSGSIITSAVFYFIFTNQNLQYMELARSIYVIPANIKSCNYEDVLTGRVHVFEFTNLC
jgi:hypothetical protein